LSEDLPALVTGASGHIGANLVRALLGRGRRVRALVHKNTVGIDGLPVEVVRADLLDGAGPGTRGRAGADMQALDLVNRGGFLPELDEAWRFIHQTTISVLAGGGHGIQRLAPFVRNIGLDGFLRRGGQQDGMHDLFQVAVGQLGVGIAGGDHFALFGQAEMTVDAAGRLGTDGMVGRAAAARDRAAPAVEDGEGDAIGPGHARNLLLGLVE